FTKFEVARPTAPRGPDADTAAGHNDVMIHRTGTAVLALTALSLSCTSQTIVVGTGGAYAEIAAAVVAAPSGATILVRAGTYQGFEVVGKSLTILCDANALVAGEVLIDGIAANQAVTLSGLTWAAGWVPPTFSMPSQLPTMLEITGCPGRVLIDRVDPTPAVTSSTYLGVFPFWTPSLVGEDCGQLVVRDSSFFAVSKLTNCTTAIESCSFEGIYEPNGGSPYNTYGLEIWSGDVRVGGTSSFQGAHGYYPGNVIEPVLPASAGLLLVGANGQFVAGTANSVQTAYAGDLGGIHLLGGQLRLAPRAVVNAVTGTPSVITPMPAITSGGSLAAGALTATADSEPNDLIVVLVGLAGVPTLVAPFADALWLDPSAFVFQAFAAPTSGTLTTTLPLPANPALAGLVIAWQAIASGPTTGFAASNPSLVVLQ
ncbi:MAG: hypothetical protein KDE27_21325, partial [Planctomycetes bacterium]|nr:hypothetical protein [Planctomycetota bacterium]